MDGNTAITTVGCDIAVSKGISICVAAGNENGSSWNHIIAPSDGDSVIAVGAVDVNGVVASFSSRGPSYDGRIKPDVSARGVSTRCVTPWDSLAYTTSSGTSLSTPLVGGACALVLQLNPDWGPMDLLPALRSEASQSESPDTVLGWGIIDTYQTAMGDVSGVMDSFSLDVALSGKVVAGTIYNGNSSAQIVDVVRRKWRQDRNGYEATDIIDERVAVLGSSSTAFSDRLASGGLYEYFLRLSDQPLIQQTEGVTVSLPFGVSLGYNVPNPFLPGKVAETVISYTVSGAPPASGTGVPTGAYSDVRLEIFNVRGARVATLVNDIKPPGVYNVSWDGRSDRGDPVASGVYFYRLRAPGHVITHKIVLIRP
jgi:hypothetical protein